MSQLILPTPVFFSPGVPLWDTASSGDGLSGTTLTVSGNGTIGGTLIVTGNGTYSNNLSVSNSINCGSNLAVSNAITAGVVNTLNTITSVVNATGSNIAVATGTATVLNSTSNTFQFSTGATYMVGVPFQASINSPGFQSGATFGTLKLFGCSASAFPIVASGNTPGYTFGTNSNNQTISGNIQFTAIAQSSSNEAIQIAGVAVGGLSNATVNVSIDPNAINRTYVTRIV